MRKFQVSVSQDQSTCPMGVSRARRRNGSDQPIMFRTLRDESGQVLPWVGLMMAVMVGMGAMAVDIAHSMVVQRQLQSSSDAVALAAAETLPNTNYTTVGNLYGASSGDMNTYNGYTITGQTVTPLCLSTVASWGAQCTTSPMVPNAVRVTETASVNTFFAWIFGKSTVTLSATSTAAAKGSVPLPYNVAIVVDSTLSMTSTDSNCSNSTQMTCALNGVLQLLSGLNPSVDKVALFTFPNITAGSSAGIVSSGTYGCTTAFPSSYSGGRYQSSRTWGYYSMLYEPSPYETPWTGAAWAMPYTFPPIPTSTAGYNPPSGTLGPTYQVTPFSNDFQTSSGALNSSSNLVKAAGGNSSCGGIIPSNYDGDYGTYYAGAIYAAQAALLAEQPNNPGSKNVIVLLGDGNSNGPSATNGAPDPNTPSMPNTATQATTTYKSTSQETTTAYTFPSNYLLASNSGTYPSWVGECGQAVTAAKYASNYSGNNTRFYTVAYGASTTSDSADCNTDVGAGSYPNISPCTTLKDMATSANYFYSDYAAQGGDTNCQASGPNNSITALNKIFSSISVDLTSVRLIPNNTN